MEQTFCIRKQAALEDHSIFQSLQFLFCFTSRGNLNLAVWHTSILLSSCKNHIPTIPQTFPNCYTLPLPLYYFTTNTFDTTSPWKAFISKDNENYIVNLQILAKQLNKAPSTTHPLRYWDKQEEKSNNKETLNPFLFEQSYQICRQQYPYHLAKLETKELSLISSPFLSLFLVDFPGSCSTSRTTSQSATENLPYNPPT